MPCYFPAEFSLTSFGCLLSHKSASAFSAIASNLEPKWLQILACVWAVAHEMLREPQFFLKDVERHTIIS